jgi:transcriptional regulator with XRE-family HTH domain
MCGDNPGMIDKERVKERLVATGLNANSASQKAGLGRDYVRDVLRDKIRDPSAQRLRRLADALECDPGYLLGGTEGAWLNQLYAEPDDRTEDRIGLIKLARGKTRTLKPGAPLSALFFDLLDSVDDSYFTELVFDIINRSVFGKITAATALSASESGILLGACEDTGGGLFERRLIVAKILKLVDNEGFYRALIVGKFRSATALVPPNEVFSDSDARAALGPLLRSFKLAEDSPKEVARLALSGVLARHFFGDIPDQALIDIGLKTA